MRKEIRVRPGYKPPEDVEIYKNKTADSWKDRGKGGVPGADFIKTSKPKKPAKKSQSEDVSKGTSQVAKTSGKTPAENASVSVEPLDPEAEKQKEIKKLNKKLRQARELQQKKEKGDALLPEQFAKVIKINELMRQLEKLGFDPEAQETQGKP